MDREVALVTDSTADIPEDLAARHDIHVMPNLIFIEGQNLEDGLGISREEFYQRLPSMKSQPSTGTAAPGKYQQLYSLLFSQGYKQILSIHAASTLSGIFNAVSTAASSFGNRVHVFDSLSITLGLGFQVLLAAEALEQGLGLEAVLERLAGWRKRTRVLAMLDTLEYLRRSGRVNWAQARIGNLLHLKPFLEVRQGVAYSLGEARTRQKGLDRLRELLLRQGPLERLAILHTNAEEDARNMLASLPFKLDPAPLIAAATTVIGTHVGPNVLGFAFILAESG